MRRVRGARAAWSATLIWALPLVVVAPMLALASALGTHEIIFPEGAALVMGIWVVGLPGWCAGRKRAAALPPLFALAGILLLRLDLTRTAALLIAVTLGLIALQACDSRLAPALSAAALPIVFDVRAWSYPVAVLVISVVVSIGMGRLPLSHPRVAQLCAQGALAPPPGRYAWSVVAGAWLAICVWILGGGALLSLSGAALAPPLFVSALEWLGRGTLTTREGVRRWALLVGAGLGGSVAVALVPVAWVAGAIAVAATLVLMVVLRTPHPPALAIGLVPQIVDEASPLGFTLAIAAGAGALYVGVYAVSRFGNLARSPANRPQAPPVEA